MRHRKQRAALSSVSSAEREAGRGTQPCSRSRMTQTSRRGQFVRRPLVGQALEPDIVLVERGDKSEADFT